MRNIIGNRKYLYAFSIILAILGLLGIILWGLKPGVDFKGGVFWQIEFIDKNPTSQSVLKAIQSAGTFKDLTVQPAGTNGFVIKAGVIDEIQHQAALAQLNNIGALREVRFDSIGPVVSGQTKNRAIEVIILVLFLISLYITFAFRRASRPVSSFKYGLATLIALFHDIFITTGFYSVYSHFSGAEVDVNFIVALLVVLGFSVHDTIVVFDRIRENLTKSRADFTEIVNQSVNQTLVRSIITSLTTIIVLFALYLFGSPVLHSFVLTLIFGIAIGTYSSIFIASPLLVEWYEKSIRK